MKLPVCVFLLFCALYSCTVDKPVPDPHSLLIAHVLQNDEQFLRDYKIAHEKGQDQKWELMSAEIDAFVGTLEVISENGERTKSFVPDTNCIIQWNKTCGEYGIIQSEVYSRSTHFPLTQCFYYKNDSVYAHGSTHYAHQSGNERLLITVHFKPVLACTPCGVKSYNDIQALRSQDSISHQDFLYEYEFLDSNGVSEGKYSCPTAAIWHFEESGRKISAKLTADTTITTVKQASYVEIEQR